MAMRIRLDGRILCAALNKAEEGDVYLDDGISYQLSVIKKVLDPDIEDGFGKWIKDYFKTN